ncbi:MAG: hypothetical protein ACR2JB_14340 [Bryobacteraceae bacterium]
MINDIGGVQSGIKGIGSRGLGGLFFLQIEVLVGGGSEKVCAFELNILQSLVVELRFAQHNVVAMQLLLAVFGGFATCLVSYFTEFVVLPALFAVAAAGFFRLLFAAAIRTQFPAWPSPA